MQDTLNCPHALDLSRMQVLEQKVRDLNVQNQAGVARHQELRKKLQNANERLKYSARQLDDARHYGSASHDNHSTSPHPLDISQLKRKVEQARAEVADVEKQIKDNQDVQELTSEKFNAAVRLRDRCKAFVADLVG
ncbi:hypothetical protein [Ciceribacter thiooxidans]|uniref:Uncharacterized protein n=1 Tax=Ciceribacter thiooxidans TaxID=1969821 RepID=A0ABV7IAD0_9HYPH|nr:hypothetical protein [Ciceribacter thiooxidans]